MVGGLQIYDFPYIKKTSNWKFHICSSTSFIRIPSEVEVNIMSPARHFI